jgi:hypothetical protein
MRLQEYYESPYMEIRGKFFKHEQYMDVYAKRNDNFTYFEDWSGFNVPGFAVADFWKLFHYDFWEKERELFDAINQNIPSFLNKQNRYYIIGTYSNEDIDHELAHAYWYLHLKYKNRMKSLISSVLNRTIKGTDETRFDILFNELMSGGYDLLFVDDEIQSYLATSTRNELIDLLGKDIINKIKIPTCFKKYFKEFDEEQKGLINERESSTGNQKKSGSRKTEEVQQA